MPDSNKGGTNSFVRGGRTLVLHCARLKSCLQKNFELLLQTRGGGTSVPHKKDRNIERHARLKPCLQESFESFLHTIGGRTLVLHSNRLWKPPKIDYIQTFRYTTINISPSPLALGNVQIKEILSLSLGGRTLIPYGAGLKPCLQRYANLLCLGGDSTSVLHGARLKSCLQFWRREFIRASYARRFA